VKVSELIQELPMMPWEAEVECTIIEASNEYPTEAPKPSLNAEDGKVYL